MARLSREQFAENLSAIIVKEFNNEEIEKEAINYIYDNLEREVPRTHEDGTQTMVKISMKNLEKEVRFKYREYFKKPEVKPQEAPKSKLEISREKALKKSQRKHDKERAKAAAETEEE